MKRLVLFTAVIALILFCVGCNSTDAPASDPVTTAVTTQRPTVTTVAVTYPFTGYITASSMHVRSDVGTGGEVIGGVHYGETVTVLEREGDWFRISFAGGTGYVSAQYVQDALPTTTVAVPETTTATESTETTTTETAAYTVSVDAEV